MTVALTTADVARHLGATYGEGGEADDEIDRLLALALGYVEAHCGSLQDDTRRGRIPALEQATLIIVRHLYESKRGRSEDPGRGFVPGEYEPTAPRFGVPRAAWEFMLPWLLPRV